MSSVTFKIIEDEFDIDLWNSKATHPLQSWEWGDIKKSSGNSLIRVGEFDKENLVNVYQITIHKIPYINKKIAYLGMCVLPSKEVIEFLHEIGLKQNWIFLKLEPNIFEENEEKIISDYKNISLVKSKHPLFYQWTNVIDLSGSEDDLFKNVDKDARYSVRLSERKGVKIVEDNTEKGFEAFYKLYSRTSQRQKYYGHSYRYHKLIWENFKDKYLHILIAYYDGKPIGAFELFSFKDILYYPYAGNDSEYKKLMASSYLIWRSMLLGKTLNCKSFDLWGIASPDKVNKSWVGFTKFKQSFGGKDKKLLGSYDLLISKSWYKFYSFLFSARSLLINIKKMLS